MPVATIDQLELPGNATPIALAAQLYAAAGFAPVPVHGVDANGCGCRNAECTAVGKHPVGASWQKRASSDMERTRELFEHHTGNIGIVVGVAHVVIDIDLYAGGAEGLLELGELPPTLTSASGSGQGEHRIFAYAPGQDPADVTNRKVAPGVDIKTRGGQVVVAPSRHVSGGVYRWIDTSPPALLPDALYERIRKPKPAARVVPIRRNAGDAQLRKRAAAYLAKIPGATSGDGGHDQTFAATRALWGFVVKGLSESDARSLLDDYNTRCDPPWTERELDHKWTDAKHAEQLPELADRTPAGTIIGGPPAPPPGGPVDEDDLEEWKRALTWNHAKTGPSKIAKHLVNAVVTLKLHPAWRGRIKLDTHAQRVLVVSPPWHPTDAPQGAREEWSDTDDSRLSAWLKRVAYGLDMTTSDCARAVALVAEGQTCHPFREYLEQLQHDGVPRLERWLSSYLGVADSPYARLVGRWWLTAAVARTFRPGCKADNVLILEGEQGIKKSTALRVLAGEKHFSDTPIDIGSKDAYLALQGKVIVELAELDSLKRADSDRAKTFFSSPVDNYRPPYARRNIAVPRGCVFAGTVNGSTYLKDDTGNRRYWPVLCTEIDLAALAALRDQLWAEAVVLFRAGARWWPDTPEERRLCIEQQEPRAESDAWEDVVARFCANRDETTVVDVLTQALKMDVGKIDRSSQTRVGLQLGALGFVRVRVRGASGGLSWIHRRDTVDHLTDAACSHLDHGNSP